MTLADELRALEIVREVINIGWLQGDLRRPDGQGKTRFCLVGAASHAAIMIAGDVREFGQRTNGLCNRTIETLNKVIEQETTFSSGSLDASDCVVDFNDCYGRTKEEVLEVVDKAIELIRAAVEEQEFNDSMNEEVEQLCLV